MAKVGSQGGGGGGLSLLVASDFKHACAICIALAFFLFVVFVDWDPIFHGHFSSSVSTSSSYEEDVHASTSSRDHSSTSSSKGGSDFDWSQESPALRKLVQDIRTKTVLASGGEGLIPDLTVAQREEWHRQNPCRSKTELRPMYDRRKRVKALSPDPRLDALVEEYSKLHRVCVQKVGPNVTDFFVRNMTVPGCTFVLGSPMYGTGLGNKLIVTISAFIYSILTQRILLVPTRTHLPSFMCEPFVGSSWRLDSSTFPFPDGPKGQLPWEGEVPITKEWPKDEEFFGAVDSWVKEETKVRASSNSSSSNGTIDFASAQPPALKYSFSVTVRWQPANRFYCRTEQRMVEGVQWLYWGGCIYSIPKMFGSPTFGPALAALFPDRMIMSRVLRSVLLPGDAVFSKFVDEDSRYFKLADRRVGIQLRNRQGKEYFQKMNMTLNDRILDCALMNGILPNVSSNVSSNMSSSGEKENNSTSSHTKIFIASLYRNLLAYLKGIYAEDVPTKAGEDVEVIQISVREEQQLSEEEDKQAFVEIMLLSLSDQLLVTPSSTFGSIAQGYGAMIPWFIETREDTPERAFGSCQRAQSIDICHQYTQTVHECPHDPSMDTQPIVDNEPALRRCLNIDHENGFQLISTFESDNF